MDDPTTEPLEEPIATGAAGCTISLCMIVKNEAVALPRCLEAAGPWVDEIVVVDTGSTDDTAAIAARAGARVISWAWRDDFAAARNESLRHATGDWILVLDADEILTDGSGDALRRACETAPSDVVGYLVKILCPREGDGGLVRLNWFPRLFRRVPGVAFEGVIHEQVIESLAPHGAIARSGVEVLHEGYTLTPEQMEAKTARNLALLERQIHDEPSYAPGWFQLAETYVLMSRLDDAIDAYRRCLRLLETSRLSLPPGVIAVALQNLGAALLARGDREDGLASIEAALRVEPNLVPARVHLGTAALADQKPEVAAGHFAGALAVLDGHGEDGEYEITPWLIHFLYGCAMARQDRHAEAGQAFRTALAGNPRHEPTLWLLALTAGHSGDWRGSLGALDRLALLGRDDFPLHSQRAAALAALGRHADAAAAARRALDLDPTSVPVLALAGESLVRSGQFAEARPVYERLAEVTPDAAPPLLALAQCHEQAGDTTAAVTAYERALAVAPESPEVLFALGSACLRAGALDAADECLAAAVERAPDRPDYHLNRALCHLKRGDVGAAREILTGLADRWPDLAQVRQLGELLGQV
jgi:tetratricopeptide (TPR) repeat protein